MLTLILILFPFTTDALAIVQNSVGLFSAVGSNVRFRTGIRALVNILSRTTQYRQLCVHLCGDSRAGKTTLRRSLYHCVRSFLFGWGLPKNCVEKPSKAESTFGLEKDRISTPFGVDEFVLFDYGGQDEYHVNHSPHLASGPDSVYVVVVGLAAVDENNQIRVRGKQDMTECNLLIKRYKYWLRFINSVAAPGSLVVTVLNFQSHVSTDFCNTVAKEVSSVQRMCEDSDDGHRCQLRNLNFWPEVVMGDLLMTKEVYSSAFFKEMEKEIKLRSPSVITGGVAAVRRYRDKSRRWPTVVPMEELKKEFLLPALMERSEMIAAQGTLSTQEWELLRDLLVTETLKGLLKNGDLLEVNDYIITDFNVFTSDVLGKLFHKGWGIKEPNGAGELSSVFDFALTSDDIEKATTMRDQFGGSVDALPMLLGQLGICMQFKSSYSEKQFWFPSFRPVPRPSAVEPRMPNPKRVVRRRFRLNEDYIFPPGYFANLYMKITELDVNDHEFGFWEDTMTFESWFNDDGKLFRIGVYIFVEASSHFDVVVCSTNPLDRVALPECGVGHQSHPHRVWHWLNCVRGFVYSLSGECPNLVRELCLDPLSDISGEKAFKEVIAEKHLEGRDGLRRFYYGSSGDDEEVLEVCTSEDMDVLNVMLDRDLLAADRELQLNTVERASSVYHELDFIVARVNSLRGKLESTKSSNLALENLSMKLIETMSDIDDLVSEVHDKLQGGVTSEYDTKASGPH